MSRRLRQMIVTLFLARMCKRLHVAAAAVALLLAPGPCWADSVSFNVYVAYADSERPSYVAPYPWQGSPGVVFEGNQGVFWDSGGIRIDNTGTSTLTFTGATVLAFFDANDTTPSGSWTLWTPTSIAPGQTLILAQTFATNANNTNFDTSDAPLDFDPGRNENTNPLGYGMAYAPKIELEINNTMFDFYDQDHILIDKGLGNPIGASHNESRPWDFVGTGTIAGVPEPSSLVLGIFVCCTAVIGYSIHRRSRA